MENETVIPAEHAEGVLHAETGIADDGHHGVFPPFDPATFGPQLVWLAITFVALYVIMSRVALPRIGSILGTRKARIDVDLAEADSARRKTEAAIANYEAALGEARAKSQALAEETRQRIKNDIDTRRKAVENDLAAKLSAAEASVAATKQGALAKVDEIAAETVEALVSRLTGSISPQQARDAVAAAAKE